MSTVPVQPALSLRSASCRFQALSLELRRSEPTGPLTTPYCMGVAWPQPQTRLSSFQQAQKPTKEPMEVPEGLVIRCPMKPPPQKVT